MRRTGCPPWSGVSAGSAEALLVLPAKTGVDTFNLKHVLPRDKNYLKQRCWKAIKSLVSWSKDCYRPREAENVNEVCQLEQGDKDGKVWVVDQEVQSRTLQVTAV